MLLPLETWLAILTVSWAVLTIIGMAIAVRKIELWDNERRSHLTQAERDAEDAEDPGM